MLLRSWVICATVSPRYSVSTAPWDERNRSAISATVATFSGFGMALLPLAPTTVLRHAKRPGAGARGVRVHIVTLVQFHLRGPPAVRGLRPPGRVATSGLRRRQGTGPGSTAPNPLPTRRARPGAEWHVVQP